jgi:hypothetical protein
MTKNNNNNKNSGLLNTEQVVNQENLDRPAQEIQPQEIQLFILFIF